MKILVTCPPMLRAIDRYREHFSRFGMEVTTPDVVQTMTEDSLVAMVPQFEGWIIGDDPATARVFAAGKAGRLRAAVKWGVGVDNVDLGACQRLGVSIGHTPGMFGREVADVALGYVIALARETIAVDRGVKEGRWPKPAGMSLAGKTVAVVGLGDIGRNTAKRLLALEMKVLGYDPNSPPMVGLDAVERAAWPDRIGEAAFIVFTCALTADNHHMLNAETLGRCQRGVRVVNVSRGGLINEAELVEALHSGLVHSVALEVFEEEPLPGFSRLREFGDRCLFGSHNASNTIEAVDRTSVRAVELLADFLNRQHT